MFRVSSRPIAPWIFRLLTKRILPPVRHATTHWKPSEEIKLTSAIHVLVLMGFFATGILSNKSIRMHLPTVWYIEDKVWAVE